jgi:hypothetical protein
MPFRCLRKRKRSLELDSSSTDEDDERILEGDVDEPPRQRLKELEEYATRLEDPEVAPLVLSRGSLEMKDGLKLWDLKKWAERQVSRKKLRGGETLKFKKLLQRVDTASKWNAKFVLIKGDDALKSTSSNQFNSRSIGTLSYAAFGNPTRP